MKNNLSSFCKVSLLLSGSEHFAQMLMYCACRPFHQLQSPKVEVFLTPDRGWGVKAAEPIAKGSFIVEYAGELCSTSD